MTVAVIRIEPYELPFLISLLPFGKGAVFVKGEALPVDISDEVKLHGSIIELLIGEHPILHEDLQTLPLLLEEATLITEEFIKSVSDFLGDMIGDLLDLSITLQIRARDVQRDIWRVDDPMQQSQVLRDDPFYVFCDEDLVSIELDLIALQLHLILHLGEVEDPRKIEGIVYIKVNPEKRLLKGLRIELVVEGNVVLIL